LGPTFDSTLKQQIKKNKKMKTTILAIALIFTMAIAASASSTLKIQTSRANSTMVVGSETLSNAGKAKKEHQKKHNKSNSTKKHSK
jgi:hypothetical protein